MASNVDKVKDSVKGLDFPFDIIVVSDNIIVLRPTLHNKLL